MNRNSSAQVLSLEMGTLKRLFEDELLLPPWLFRQQELSQALENAKKLDHSELLNKLNYIHFIGEEVYINMRHQRYREGILLKAHPEPCIGNEITCTWADGDLSGLKLDTYSFQWLIISDGQSIIFVPSTLVSLDAQSISMRIESQAYLVGQRTVRRYMCQSVRAELMQSGFVARGNLMDFSPVGFRIRVNPDPQCSFNWLNPDEMVYINLYNNDQVVLSGFCNVLRQGDDSRGRDMVLTPSQAPISRFRKKVIRNTRYHLTPQPTVHFEHPFTKKRVQRMVADISTSGLSLEEPADEGVLIPGMVISELVINYAGLLKLKCKAQVMYRKPEGPKSVKCGLAILDMDIRTYSRLSQIISSSQDVHSNISNEVDMDALWEFFFDTGFIYPKKYRLFQSYREDFKETYRKLYQENPEIARHFTYEKDGKIFAHMSMIRAYDRSWVIHHHAARPMSGRRTGFMVLKQIMNYINGVYLLPSANMDYVICYFRPDNRFPDMVFGDFSRTLQNPQGCSLDLFAYLPFPTDGPLSALPQGWVLKESSALELWEFELFYKNRSGGLLIDSFGLKPRRSDNEGLKRLYSKLGLIRNWQLYSLVHERELKAIMIVNQSDLGINLSELLNSITVLIVDQEGLSWDILSRTVMNFTVGYKMDNIPVMIYPFEYAEENSVPFEKQYNLWVLSMQSANEYLQYMQQKFGVNF